MPIRDESWDRIRKALAEDDPAALEMIWNAASNTLYACALAVTGRAADAEDVVQDLFVKVARERARLSGCRNLPAYLHRMARNLAVSRLRRRVRAECPTDPIILELEPAPEAVEPVDTARVGAAVGALPEKLRAVVVLRALQGLSFRDVAAALGIPLFTAASRYRYGLARLRAALTEDGDEG